MSMRRDAYMLLSLVLLIAVFIGCKCDPCPSNRYQQNYDYELPPSLVDIVHHPTSARVQPGSTVSFNCSISEEHVDTGYSSSVLYWRFNGTSLQIIDGQGSVDYPGHWSVNSQGSFSELTLVNVTTPDHGYYECVVGDGFSQASGNFTTVTVSKRAWLNGPNDTGLIMPPVLTGSNEEIHGLNGVGNKAFIRHCSTSGPDQTLYWYKDGQDITDYYNSTTGNLTYDVQSDLYGIYQCFVENSAGSDYINYRVLRPGFANRPSNFSCRAIDQEVDPQKVKIVVSWDTPSLVVGNLPESYTVKFNGECYSPTDEHYFNYFSDADLNIHECAVFLNNPHSGFDGYISPDFKRVNTITQRRFEQSSVRHLSVTCPSPDSVQEAGEGVINVSLPTPEVHRDNIACLTKLNLRGECFYGNRSTDEEEFILYGEEFSAVVGYCEGEKDSYILPVPSQPLGAVCKFGGEYFFDDLDKLIIPEVSCGVPYQPTGDEQLRLSCSESQANISLTGQSELTVAGKCRTTKWEMVTLDPTPLSPGEVLNVSGLSRDSICTFYVVTENQTSTPVQCITDTVATIILPETTPPVTAPSTSENIASSQNGGEARVPSFVWGLVSLVAAFLILVAVVIGVLLLLYVISCHRHHQRSREKKHLHSLARIVEQQLKTPESPPVDPYAQPDFHNSSLSILTEVDYLYQETGRMILKEPLPTLTPDGEAPTLMDKFLAGSEQKSEARTTPVPDTEVLEYLTETTENYLNSTASSSGYGTAHAVDEREYFEQRLKDVSLSDEKSAQGVREYFELDLEGYVHMVPYRKTS